jgi:hypothetical protein
MNRISALIKRTSESSLSPSLPPEDREKMVVYKPGSKPLPHTKSVGRSWIHKPLGLSEIKCVI